MTAEQINAGRENYMNSDPFKYLQELHFLIFLSTIWLLHI